MLTIKISSTNYLLWKNQINPLFCHQHLLDHVDGKTVEVMLEGKSSLNPLYDVWLEADQRAMSIVQASLTKECMAEILGLTTTRDVWITLESAYSQDLIERMQNLHDGLHQLQKGTLYVSNYGLKYKSICDQLAAIGHLVDEADKYHWFLCSLGSFFETFSTTHQAVK